MKTRLLQCVSPRRVEAVEIDLPDVPKPGTLYIQCAYMGISAGTELNTFRGGVNWHTGRDPKTNLFSAEKEKQEWKYPASLGYACVGKVIAVAEDVTGFRVGDMAFSPGSHGTIVPVYEKRTYHAAPSGDLRPYVFLQLIRTALNLIHHAQINAGDTVAIFGLGPVGLLTLQIARKSGAGRIACFDPIEKRRSLALELGADAVFDPREVDPANRLFEWNGNRGADAAIECAANAHALHQATRAVGRLGRVVLGSLPGKPFEFHFGQEVHFNGIQIRGANVMQMPLHLGPLWDIERQTEYAVELIDKLRLVELITHEFSFDQAQEAYEFLEQNPQDIVSALFAV